MIPADFHFLRPLWLIALLPALALAFAGWRALRSGREDWRGVVDAHLLRHLAVRGTAGPGRWPLAALLAGFVLASFAMAGPTWRKLPTPALDRLDPTVMVLNLGRTMDATDQAPSRLTAARHKVEDMLARQRGAQVGLIVFADVPFVAAPLTEDGRIIGQMLPELSTDLMPVTANRPDLALSRAVELLQGAGAREGRIVLVTDGVGDAPEKTRAAARAAVRAGYKVSVIGVGTVAGSPMPADNRGDGPALTRMDKARLTQLAADGGGDFTPMTVDSRDLDAVFAKASGTTSRNPLQDSGMTADQWADMGPYLVLVLLVLAPLAFRRGLITVLLLGLLATQAGGRAEAQTTGDTRWADLWQRPDQQGASAFASGDYAGAAARFEDPNWRAGSLYKAGRFQEAADAYAGVPGGDYNRGNALARAGKLNDALAAYDAALKADPKNADALFNRDIVHQLLQKQKDEEQKNQSGGGGGLGGGGGGGGGSDQSQDKGANDQKSAGNKPSGAGADKGDNKDKNKGQDKNKDQGSNKDKGQNKDPSKGTSADQGQQQTPDHPDTGKKPDAENKPEPGKTPQDGAKGEQPKDKGGQNQDGKDPGNKDKPDPAKDGQNKDPKAPEQPGAGPKPPGAAPQPAGPGPTPQPEPQPGEDPRAQPRTGARPVPVRPQPAGEGGPDQANGKPDGLLLRPMSEQDQNNEQALRMVPDDPSGLLRARIRAYYGGSPLAVPQEAPLP